MFLSCFSVTCFSWTLFREDIGPSLLADFEVVDPVQCWNEPEFDPGLASGVVALMRLFAVGASASADTKGAHIRRVRKSSAKAKQ